MITSSYIYFIPNSDDTLMFCGIVVCLTTRAVTNLNKMTKINLLLEMNGILMNFMRMI